MNRASIAAAPVARLPLPGMLLALTASVAWAGGDPTVPSPQIAELLAAPSAIAPPVAAAQVEVSSTPDLRLLGIVLRNADHGTAIISAGGLARYTVTLRRNEQSSEPQMLDVGGALFVIESFGPDGILLRSVRNEQLVYVR